MIPEDLADTFSDLRTWLPRISSQGGLEVQIRILEMLHTVAHNSQALAYVGIGSHTQWNVAGNLAHILTRTSTSQGRLWAGNLFPSTWASYAVWDGVYYSGMG